MYLKKIETLHDLKLAIGDAERHGLTPETPIQVTGLSTIYFYVEGNVLVLSSEEPKTGHELEKGNL